jgi:hypothetical protein
LGTTEHRDPMEQNTPKEPVDTRRHRTSWRLTFRFDGQEVTLIRRERLQKVAPGTTTDKLTPGKNSGAWLALLDREGQPLFHRLLSDPFHARARHHSPDRRIELHVRKPESGEFTVVVPDIPGAVAVALYSSPTDREHMLDPATQVGRYSLIEPKSRDSAGREEKEDGK